MRTDEKIIKSKHLFFDFIFLSYLLVEGEQPGPESREHLLEAHGVGGEGAEGAVAQDPVGVAPEEVALARVQVAGLYQLDREVLGVVLEDEPAAEPSGMGLD